MNLNKKYEEFKRFPLTIKLCFFPAITLGIALIVGFVWMSVVNPFWLLTQVLTFLFVISFLKLLFFFLVDYPNLKKQMEEERAEALKPFE